MPSLTEPSPTEPDPYNPQQAFYRNGIALLQASEIPFLVGGTYAMRHYTGVVRETRTSISSCVLAISSARWTCSPLPVTTPRSPFPTGWERLMRASTASTSSSIPATV